MKFLISFLMIVALAAVGCGQSGDGDQADTTPAAEPAAHGADDGHGHDHGDGADHSHGTAPATTDAQVAATTVTGTMGCGHCTYGIGDGCSAAVKTAEGKVWILDGIAQGHELFDHRMDGKTVTVEGSGAAGGETAKMTVASYEIQ